MNSVNVTVRFSEEELQRLDDLAQRMNKTRSDVVRDLVNRFDEALREEVEKERKKWTAIGVVTALESAIVDPGLILRFIRRNVNILGFPDFIIGMVRVRNRVVLFSHHDRTGSQLLQLIRSRIEEEIRREEAEIEQEGGEDGEVGAGRAARVRISANRPARPNTVRAIPVAAKYRLVTANRAAPPIARPTATSAAGKPVNNSGGGSAKVASNASVAEKQKSATTGIPTSTNPVVSQTRDSSPQPSSEDGGANSVRPVGQGLEDGHGGGSGRDMPSPVGRVSTHGLAGDFVTSLITNLYHKHRNELLKAVEDVMGG